MNARQFDVVVLGTGPAGSTIARKAAKSGRSVALVESREFGGTCALRGCNPKKVYVNAASLIDQVRRADGRLVAGEGVAIDWPQLLAFKKTFTDPIAERSERSFQKAGIATLHGNSMFVSERELSVDGERISGERIVIATGARPRPLRIPGEPWMTSSDKFMELQELPARVLFVGGGYVSMEFAHVVARCGKAVTVVDHHDRVLAGFDLDLVTLLMDYSERQGMAFRLGRRVEGVERQKTDEAAGVLDVTLDNGDRIECDLAVHGAGRVPNISALQLEQANVEYASGGIVVDDFMRSVSNPRIFAAGDCAASGEPMLTPTANEEARIIAKNLFSKQPEAKPEYGPIPKVVFTVPSIAAVGMSEQQAREACEELDVRFGETSNWGSNRKTGDTVAAYKLLVDKRSDQLLGAHLLGPLAEETINLFAMAMRFKLTATDMKSTLFAFPTFAADVRSML